MVAKGKQSKARDWDFPSSTALLRLRCSHREPELNNLKTRVSWGGWSWVRWCRLFISAPQRQRWRPGSECLQPGLHSEVQASQVGRERICLKQQQGKNPQIKQKDTSAKCQLPFLINFQESKEKKRIVCKTISSFYFIFILTDYIITHLFRDYNI